MQQKTSQFKLLTRLTGITSKSALLLLSFLSISLLSRAQGYVLNFDGVDDAVVISSSVSTGLRSIELWFKPDTTIDSTISDYKILIARNDGNQIAEYGLGFSYDTGHEGALRFACSNNNQWDMVYSTQKKWVAGTWYHAVAVIDATDGLKLYVNGTLVGTNSARTTAISARSESAALGRWGNTAQRYFKGSMDNVRLWSRALSAAEASNHRCTAPSNTSGLIVEWMMNEGSGTSISDASGNGNSGALAGCTWTYDNPCSYVLNFDGVGDAVVISATVSTGLRSIELWFKPTVTIDNTITDYKILIARNDGNQIAEYGLGFSYDTGHEGALRFACSNNNQWDMVYSTQTTWTAGTWYHAVAVIDATDGLKLYVNGALVGTNSARTASISARSESAALGRWGNTAQRYFSGSMDNVRLWSRVLSATEASDHRCSAPSSRSGLIAEWMMNEGSGTSIVDASGNGNSGALVGCSWTYDSYCYGLKPDALSIHHLTENAEGIKLYPNPVNDILIVENAAKNDCTYSIYDMTGRLIKVSSVSAIDVSDMAEGAYLLRVVSSDGKSHKKQFIKTN